MKPAPPVTKAFFWFIGLLEFVGFIGLFGLFGFIGFVELLELVAPVKWLLDLTGQKVVSHFSWDLRYLIKPEFNLETISA